LGPEAEMNGACAQLAHSAARAMGFT
jgi:hypothetical protein